MNDTGTLEYDTLTGLYNKETFYRKVRQQLHAEPEKAQSLVYANIDDFKLVNDLFGRRTGDAVLIKTAEYLAELCGTDGICARITADRFVLCMAKRRFSEDSLNGIAERLSTVIKKNADPVCIRFGVYHIEDPQVTVSVMAGYAKRALKAIKGDTVKRVAYYDNTFLRQKQREQRIMASFDDALHDRQFKIFLQPQISAEGALQGAEVLVRWIHPEQGLIPPGEFIGTLEKTGLISRLDKNVWEQAAEVLRQWQGTEKDGLYLSINLSAKDFYYLDVYETITQLAERYGIAPQKLRLEITESVLMSDVEKLMDITQRLHERGFYIEIDDFGKGYSSLSMLKDIDVDVLKIDMEFLNETEHEEKGRIILESIIEMSKRLGMAVITEGVETQAQAELLQSIGCDMFQGYYFAKPMPVQEFERKYFRIV